MNILVLNSGSSSVKFKLFKDDDVLREGRIEGIGLKNSTISFDGTKESVFIKDHDQAIELVLHNLSSSIVDVIAHRVVHGGSFFNTPTIINDDVIEKIRELSALAPLHNPHNLAGILSCKKHFPEVIQVAVFDTSFHQTLPKHSFMYSLPREFYEKYGIRKYGFHGISHNYILEESKKILGKDVVNIISIHCGGGTSLCAIKNNVSIETSMGFTPLEGVLMGTRAGDLDPGVPLYIAHKEHLTLDQVDHLLNMQRSLKGLTGESDMRTIHEMALSGDEYSILARDMLAYRIAKYIGAYYAIIGPIDAIVFTAGLGENDWDLRKKVCSYIEHLGFVIDDGLNEANKTTLISSMSSKIKILVIPTNEELMIARKTKELFSEK